MEVELIFVCSLQHNVNHSDINKCNGGSNEENAIQDLSVYYRVTMTTAWSFSKNIINKSFEDFELVTSFFNFHLCAENYTNFVE